MSWSASGRPYSDNAMYRAFSGNRSLDRRLRGQRRHPDLLPRVRGVAAQPTTCYQRPRTCAGVRARLPAPGLPSSRTSSTTNTTATKPGRRRRRKTQPRTKATGRMLVDGPTSTSRIVSDGQGEGHRRLPARPRPVRPLRAASTSPQADLATLAAPSKSDAAPWRPWRGRRPDGGVRPPRQRGVPGRRALLQVGPHLLRLAAHPGAGDGAVWQAIIETHGYDPAKGWRWKVSIVLLRGHAS